jgi:hypothetical protein
MKQLCGILTILFFLFAAITYSGTRPTTRIDKEHAPAVHVEMKNLTYHFTPSVAAHVIWLDGQLVATKPGEIPTFDDPPSFALQVQNAKISIAADALGGVMNQHVFDGSEAPLSHLAVEARGDLLHITGRLHDKGDIPFSMDGTLSTTRDGNIRIHSEKISALHIPVKGMMDLIGLKISNLVNAKKLQGIQADGDDLILDVEKILPPPQIRGRIAHVQIEGNQIVETYGEGTPRKQGPGNYMFYRGGELRFGKLTMTDADLMLIDMNPADPFDFYLEAYKRQLVAGYAKMTSSFGLRVYMRDFDKLNPSK